MTSPSLRFIQIQLSFFIKRFMDSSNSILERIQGFTESMCYYCNCTSKVRGVFLFRFCEGSLARVLSLDEGDSDNCSSTSVLRLINFFPFAPFYEWCEDISLRDFQSSFELGTECHPTVSLYHFDIQNACSHHQEKFQTNYFQ